MDLSQIAQPAPEQKRSKMETWLKVAGLGAELGKDALNATDMIKKWPSTTSSIVGNNS